MRIITRGDFDGLICSVLVTEAEEISDIRLTHPKIIQDKEIPVTPQDIILNLPYHPDCGMWFDHHASESESGNKPESFKGKYGLAPSCARLVYEYYSLPGWEKYSELIDATDNIDSAQLNLNDILRPQGWVRLSNTVDPRSGFKGSKEYFLQLIDWIKEYDVKDILAFDEVKDKVREFFKQHQEYEKALRTHSYMDRSVVITDFRSLNPAPVGSRFLVYALYPTANVSVRVYHAYGKSLVAIAVGHSILNRTCKVDIGNMLSEYGGGGHVGAGTCRVPPTEADDVIQEIANRLNS